MRTIRVRRPSPAMVVACVALGVALSGTGYAALQLPRNSVGAKQLRNGAVTSTKLRNGAVTSKKLARRAVTAVKVAPNSLGGEQIDESALGRVQNATHASSADTATSAATAQALAAAEAFHLVGAAGEPAFQNAWTNKGGTFDLPAGFYKDRTGIVHLRGRMYNGPENNVIFQLPPGYRPASGKFIDFAVACECVGAQTTIVSVAGSGLAATVVGGLRMENGSLQPGGSIWLDGISFRAES